MDFPSELSTLKAYHNLSVGAALSVLGRIHLGQGPAFLAIHVVSACEAELDGSEHGPTPASPVWPTIQNFAVNCSPDRDQASGKRVARLSR